MARVSKSTCIICGKETQSDDYREVHIYCDEHREYAERDREIIRTTPLEYLYGLIAGIFFRARLDYMTDADGKRADAEAFFRSDWAQDLSLSKFDVEELLDRLDEEAEYGFDYHFESPF